MGKFDCEICGKGPSGGVAVYRQNAPGEMPARWLCIKHNEVAIDPEVHDIVLTLEEAQQRESRSVG